MIMYTYTYSCICTEHRRTHIFSTLTLVTLVCVRVPQDLPLSFWLSMLLYPASCKLLHRIICGTPYFARHIALVLFRIQSFDSKREASQAPAHSRFVQVRNDPRATTKMESAASSALKRILSCGNSGKFWFLAKNRARQTPWCSDRSRVKNVVALKQTGAVYVNT